MDTFLHIKVSLSHLTRFMGPIIVTFVFIELVPLLEGQFIDQPNQFVYHSLVSQAAFAKILLHKHIETIYTPGTFSVEI